MRPQFLSSLSASRHIERIVSFFRLGSHMQKKPTRHDGSTYIQATRLALFMTATISESDMDTRMTWDSIIARLQKQNGSSTKYHNDLVHQSATLSHVKCEILITSPLRLLRHLLNVLLLLGCQLGHTVYFLRTSSSAHSPLQKAAVRKI